MTYRPFLIRLHKDIKIKQWLIELILTLLVLLVPIQVESYEAEVEPVEVKELTTEEKIEERFGHIPHMVETLRCESGLRQFDSVGNPLKSPTNDYGIGQINDYTWSGRASELGIDYKNNIEGNLDMIEVVLEEQGIEAWVCYFMVTGQHNPYY